MRQLLVSDRPPAGRTMIDTHVLTRGLRRHAAVALVASAVLLAAAVWDVVREPSEPESSPLIVNDVTRLNPIAVGRVIAPTTTDQIVDIVKQSGGPIAVGGARHSMGGQIATAGGLHIDMRHFDRILDSSPAQKTVRVQAGVRWRQIQERI